MRQLALAFVWCVAAAAAMAVPRYDLMPWAGEPGKAYPPCEALRGEWVPWATWEALRTPFVVEPTWAPAVTVSTETPALLDDGSKTRWLERGWVEPLDDRTPDAAGRILVRDQTGTLRAIAFPQKPTERPACLLFAYGQMADFTDGVRGVKAEERRFLPFWLDNLLGNPARQAGVQARFAELPREKRKAAAQIYGRAQRVLARERLGVPQKAPDWALMAALRTRMKAVDLPPLPASVCRAARTNDVLTLRLANPTRRTLTIPALPRVDRHVRQDGRSFMTGAPLRLPEAEPYERRALCLRPGETRTLRYRLVADEEAWDAETTLVIAAPTHYDGAWHAFRFESRIPGRHIVAIEPMLERKGWHALALSQTVPAGWRVAPMPEGLLQVRFADCGPFEVPGGLVAETQAEKPLILGMPETRASCYKPDGWYRLDDRRRTVFPGQTCRLTAWPLEAARALAGLETEGPFTVTFDAYALDPAAQVAHPLHAERTYARPTEDELRREWGRRNPPREERSPEHAERLAFRIGLAEAGSPALAPGWLSLALKGETLTLTFANRSDRPLTVANLPKTFYRTDDVFRLDGTWRPIPRVRHGCGDTAFPETTFTLAPGAARTFRWRVKGLSAKPKRQRPAFIHFCDSVTLDGKTFDCDLSLPLFTDNPIAIALTPCEDAPDKAGEGTSKAR